MILDFQHYLASICTTYEKWWQLYTLTDATGKQPQSKAGASSFFDFGLMVQTVKRKERDRQPEEKVEPFSVLEGLRKYADQQVLLVGRPGSGKSTALARLMLEEATDSQGRIPVLVELRYWQGSIEPLILNSLSRHGLVVEQLGSVLSRSLLLFDGVNELPSEEARSQLSAFRRNHPKLPMIFTTRDLSIGGDLGIEQKLEMQPLTEEQMREFVRSYLSPEKAEKMLRQLNDRLREFGQTPLLLWMLCGLFQQTETIPENLGLVFREFTQGYERYLKDDVRIESDKAWWKPVLQQLAWVMMQGEKPTEFRVAISQDEAVRAISQFLDRKVPYAEDFARKCLRDLQKHHLIQAGTNQEELEFRHQLIQEYYAAEALLEQVRELSDEELKREYLNYMKWTEPVALLLLMVHEGRALQIVSLAIEIDLMLGAKLAGKVPSHLHENTIELINCLDIQFIRDIRRFGEGEEQTVRIVDRRTLTQSLSDEYFEQSPKLKELVELGLIVNLSRFSDALKVRLLSASGSKAAIPKLIEVLEQAVEEENPDIRDAAIIGLVKNSSIQELPILVNLFLHQEGLRRDLIRILVDSETGDSNHILESIVENCPPQNLSELLDIIYQRLSLRAAVKQFSEVNPSYLEEQRFSQDEMRAWLYQLSESGRNGDETSIRLLLDTLQDTDTPTTLRCDALDALLRIKNHPKVTSAIFEMLEDDLCDCVTGVRASVIDGIGELGDITMLLPLFEHMFYTLGNIEICWDNEWDKVLKAIASIQSRSQFYNYEIYQAYLEAQNVDRQTPQNRDRSRITQNFYAPVDKVIGNVEGNLNLPSGE